MYKIKHICMYFLFSYVVEHTCCVCLLASFAFLPMHMTFVMVLVKLLIVGMS
jgi:hypothetical protein